MNLFNPVKVMEIECCIGTMINKLCYVYSEDGRGSYAIHQLNATKSQTEGLSKKPHVFTRFPSFLISDFTDHN